MIQAVKRSVMLHVQGSMKALRKLMVGSAIQFGILTVLVLALVDEGWSSDQVSRATAQSPGSGPTWAGTEAAAKAERHLAYGGRPVDVQAVMRLMYRNDNTYSHLSALFVDAAPGDSPSSVLIDIRQPDMVRTAAYSGLNGSGAPAEITLGEQGDLIFYSPAAGAYTRLGRVVSGKLMDLTAVPLSVVQKDHSGTSIYAGAFGGTAPVLADMLIHPASLLASPFFTNKHIVQAEAGTLDELPVWVLRGTQAPGAPLLGALGDSWRMWVDKRTGIVLRLEYYSDAALIGTAEFRDLSIDGSAAPSGALASLVTWSLPASAHLVPDLIEYNRLVNSYPHP